MAVREHGVLLWSWRVVRGRPRLFIGMACGLAVVPLLPDHFNHTTRAILAWDFGVIVFLLGLAGILFAAYRKVWKDKH